MLYGCFFYSSFYCLKGLKEFVFPNLLFLSVLSKLFLFCFQIVSPFPPSDKIGINSVQRESEEIIPMKQMKMDWVPYIPLENRYLISYVFHRMLQVFIFLYRLLICLYVINPSSERARLTDWSLKFLFWAALKEGAATFYPPSYALLWMLRYWQSVHYFLKLIYILVWLLYSLNLLLLM